MPTRYRASEPPRTVDVSPAAQPSTELLELMTEDADHYGMPDDPGGGGDGSEENPLGGVAFGATLIEQLLYGIIVAHPLSTKAGTAASKTDEQRLNAAMKALFDRKRSRNPLPGDIDDKALLWMKEDQKRAQREGKKVSDRALAIQAAQKFIKGFNAKLDMTPADRLREKFSGTYDKKQPKGRRIDAPATLSFRVFQHDYVVESLERQILVRIAEELRGAGVAVTLPEE